MLTLHVRAEEEPDLQLSEPMQQEMDILAAERAQTQQALDGQEEDGGCPPGPRLHNSTRSMSRTA